MTAERLEEYVDVFINVFTKEPWNDVYESRGQVEAFFRNYMADNYFLGWALMRGGRCAGLCFGAKKPWLAGMEYWIDQFCVTEEFQRRGVGTLFLALVEKRGGAARAQRDNARHRARLSLGKILSQKRLPPPRRYCAVRETALNPARSGERR